MFSSALLTNMSQGSQAKVRTQQGLKKYELNEHQLYARPWLGAYTHLFNTHSSLVAVCPSSPKPVPDGSTVPEIYEGTWTGSWTWDAGVAFVKERGEEGRLNGRKHLMLQ